MMVPSNGLPLSCAALRDRNHVCAHLALKNATILRPRSGVSYSGGLGGPVRRALDRIPDDRLAAPMANLPSDEAEDDQARHLPRGANWPSDEAEDDQAKHLPRRLKVPSDQACAEHTRHLP